MLRRDRYSLDEASRFEDLCQASLQLGGNSTDWLHDKAERDATFVLVLFLLYARPSQFQKANSIISITSLTCH